jgi:hypothetical protein
VRACMAAWISAGRHFIEADVIRWIESAFQVRRYQNSKPVTLGERRMTAEVLHKDEKWVYLLVRHCELMSVKAGRLERQVPLVPKDTEIRRQLSTLVDANPERLQWSDESARSVVISKFLGPLESTFNARSPPPPLPEPPAAPRPHATPSAKGPGANGPSKV